MKFDILLITRELSVIKKCPYYGWNLLGSVNLLL